MTGSDEGLVPGFSESTTQSWPFEQGLARHAPLELAVIEVVEAKLDAVRLPEQITSVAEAALAISGVPPKVRTYGGWTTSREAGSLNSAP